MPTAVQAWAVTLNNSHKQGMYDMIYYKLDFENNVTAYIKNGTLSLSKTRSITIIGTKKSIIYDELADKKIRMVATDFLTDISEISYPQYATKKSLDIVIEEFISCIQSKKQPKSNIENAIQVAKVIDALERSIVRKGKKVSL
jgi:predicted dehydrogenase